MYIRDRFRGSPAGSAEPVISFEFFPPKTDSGFQGLFETIADLKRLDPAFVSVTWGAGGSTRRKTVELVARIQDEAGLVAMAHLSCVGSTRDQLAVTLDQLGSSGVRNLLPLGGDRPEGYVRPEGAFDYANELVAFIRTRGSEVCLAGACYPEVHPSAPDAETDMRMLVQKVEAGVDFLITQLFFDNDDYFRFVERARATGISVPIVPGIMPVISTQSIRRMAALSGARIPTELAERLEAAGDDPERTLAAGVEQATEQCRDLLERGAPGIHFYTLNRSPATRRVFERLFG